MSGLNALRRGAAAAGACTILALSLVSPAQARLDPGPAPTTVRQQTTNSYEGGTVRSVLPPAQVVRVNDSGAQYLQLGGGLLAGIAIGGAGMVLASRRTHSHLRPA